MVLCVFFEFSRILHLAMCDDADAYAICINNKPRYGRVAGVILCEIFR